ncbi:MAG: DMT family transporter [Acidimicrobiia bacterium]
MAFLLGLLTAGAFGSSDFLGGFVTRRNAVTAVLVTTLATGFLVSPLLLVLFPEPFPGTRVVLLSAGVGIIGTAGLGLLFTGLSIGRMSVVAPISAVGSSVIPVLWGILTGERPSVVAVVGIVAALVAIVLVARGPEAQPFEGGSRVRELLVAAGAGIGFGVAFIFFSETGDHAGFWPVFLSRCFSLPILLVIVVVARLPKRLTSRDYPLSIGGALLELSANAFQLLAFRRGLISLVAPVSGLYPAVTVLLARVVLSERMGRSQVAGLAIALTGLVLIAVG